VSISSRNEPHRVVADIAAAVSLVPSSNAAQRSAGTSPTVLPPSASNCHNASGPAIPPGSRQPRPMTAIGSFRVPTDGT
jgi:hypothetical protein